MHVFERHNGNGPSEQNSHRHAHSTHSITPTSTEGRRAATCRTLPVETIQYQPRKRTTTRTRNTMGNHHTDTQTEQRGSSDSVVGSRGSEDGCGLQCSTTAIAALSFAYARLDDLLCPGNATG